MNEPEGLVGVSPTIQTSEAAGPSNASLLIRRAAPHAYLSFYFIIKQTNVYKTRTKIKWPSIVTFTPYNWSL